DGAADRGPGARVRGDHNRGRPGQRPRARPDRTRPAEGDGRGRCALDRDEGAAREDGGCAGPRRDRVRARDGPGGDRRERGPGCRGAGRPGDRRQAEAAGDPRGDGGTWTMSGDVMALMEDLRTRKDALPMLAQKAEATKQVAEALQGVADELQQDVELAKQEN